MERSSLQQSPELPVLAAASQPGMQWCSSDALAPLPHHAHRLYDAANPKAVVSVHVCDCDGADGGWVELSPLQLVARALPAIHQENIIIKADCRQQRWVCW
jgi:hypothetical protein